MGSLCSSPSSNASSASSGAANASNSEIAQEENYVAGQDQQLRTAIGNLGPNPYFQAAGSMSPTGYAVSPSNTAAFGNAAPQAQPNFFAAPTAPQNLFAAPPGGSRSAQPIARGAGTA